jgi:hypothetical protein
MVVLKKDNLTADMVTLSKKQEIAHCLRKMGGHVASCYYRNGSRYKKLIQPKSLHTRLYNSDHYLARMQSGYSGAAASHQTTKPPIRNFYKRFIHHVPLAILDR